MTIGSHLQPYVGMGLTRAPFDVCARAGDADHAVLFDPSADVTSRIAAGRATVGRGTNRGSEIRHAVVCILANFPSIIEASAAAADPKAALDAAADLIAVTCYHSSLVRADGPDWTLGEWAREADELDAIVRSAVPADLWPIWFRATDAIRAEAALRA